MVLIILDRIGTYTLCAWAGQQDTGCIDVLSNTMVNFFPVISFFLFSLITYKMRNEVYSAWLRFSYVWIPLSMTAIFLAPEYSGDLMYPIEKGSVALITSLLFVVISFLIIVWKYFATRGK